MTKTCTTCKWEPAWENESGNCKKLPWFMKQGVWLYKHTNGSVSCQFNEFEDAVEFEDCNLWEAKDE